MSGNACTASMTAYCSSFIGAHHNFKKIFGITITISIQLKIKDYLLKTLQKNDYKDSNILTLLESNSVVIFLYDS